MFLSQRNAAKIAPARPKLRPTGATVAMAAAALLEELPDAPVAEDGLLVPLPEEPLPEEPLPEEPLPDEPEPLLTGVAD